MNCIIIDDEPLAQKGLESFVQEIPYLNLVATCDNVRMALDELSKQRVDLLFLDIKMPKITGIEFLKSMKNPPLTIITSAYTNYALESYEFNVIDYLVKPIPFERFLKAVDKAQEYLKLKMGQGHATQEDYCFIRCDKRYEKIFFDDIIYIEALQNYIVIFAKDRKLISYLTMKNMEEYLPADRFIKVNKSFIVPIAKVDNISGNMIQIGAHSFTIGRPFREQVMERLLGNKLIKRS